MIPRRKPDARPQISMFDGVDSCACVAGGGMPSRNGAYPSKIRSASPSVGAFLQLLTIWFVLLGGMI